MGINSLIEDATGLIQSNPVAAAVIGAGAGIAVGAGAAVAVGALSNKSSKRRRSKSSRKRGRRIRHTSRGWKQDRRRRSKQSWEVAYRKRKSKKSRSKRGIHYTKNGQPYKILASGKARFIKRRSKR